MREVLTFHTNSRRPVGGVCKYTENRAGTILYSSVQSVCSERQSVLFCTRTVLNALHSVRKDQRERLAAAAGTAVASHRPVAAMASNRSAGPG